MKRYFAVALVGLATLAWTSSASAATVDVTYGFMMANYDVGAPPSTATGQGTFTIRYSEGSTVTGGTLASGQATLLTFGLLFTAGTVPTIFANTVPGFAVLASQVGTRSAGGTDTFNGMSWTIPPGPGVPASVIYTGNLAHTVLSGFSGAGLLSLPAFGGLTQPWTVSGGSAELCRGTDCNVPEPALAHLLGSAAGMLGLAMAGTAGARRVRR